MRKTRHRKSLCVTATVAALLPFIATADTLNGAGGGWQTWTQAQLYQGTSPTPGTPYWNNLSGDGFQGNVGWCLSGGTATCPLVTPAPIPYYGASGGGSVGDMFFTSSGVPLTLTVADVITNEKSVALGYDVFGYYLANASGVPTGSLVNVFDTRTAVSGATFTLNLMSGQNYGFFLENIQGGGGSTESDYYFYMNSSSNNNVFNHGAPTAGPESLQHFAIFQTGNGYVVGAVDGYACSNPNQQGVTPCELASQFDYQDLIVTESPTVPEPATMGLMAISLLFVAGLVRYSLRKRSVKL